MAAVTMLRQVLAQTMVVLACVSTWGEVAPVGAFFGVVPAGGLTETNTGIDGLVTTSIMR